MSDCRVSFSATFYKDDFILGTCKSLSGVTISGATSGLEASLRGYCNYVILEDKGTHIELQIGIVLHLKKLPQSLIRTQQLFQQYYSHGDGFFLCNAHAILKLGG